jgi:hypothetical protein
LGAAACLVGVGLLELGLFTFLPLLRWAFIRLALLSCLFQL